MGKRILTMIFAALALGGVGVSGYLLYTGENDWSTLFIGVLSLLSGLIVLILPRAKKNDGITNGNKTDTRIEISGNNNFAEAILEGKNVIQKGETHHHYYGGIHHNIVSETPPAQNNLPNRNLHFTGREELLDNIHKAFQTKNSLSLVRAQAIKGMGGIGKSETAKEYAYRYRDEYKHIWWVNAETDASIEAAYRSFAQRIKLCSPEDNSETIIASVKKWMNDNRRWLFIFDNAENEKSLEKYCSSSGEAGQHILVTSRNQLFQKYASIDINVFSEQEACEFIEKYTQKPADDFFKELAQKMDYLPLALDQAAAYMYHNKMSYKDYLDLYDKYNLELLADNDDDPDKKTVATTWKISFEKIKNPTSHQLLNLFAYLAPDNISKQWFVDANEVLPDELREVAANDLQYLKAITELTKYSLINLDEKGTISIHRLVQQVIRESLKNEQNKWRNYCISILHELRYFDFSTAESRDLFRTLAPHVEVVTKDINDDNATREVANLYYFLGWGFDDLADYNKALEYYEKALAIYEEILGKEHPLTALAYNNIAAIYDKQGNYGKALEYCEKALAIREKVLGTEHPDTATTYDNIAAVYGKQDDYGKALEYCEKALAIREKVLGTEHPDTATTYNNIGIVYEYKYDYEHALEYYGKALSIREKFLGTEHPYTATTYNNIASVYRAQGDYEYALEYFVKSLTIRVKVLGVEHPYTKETLEYMEDTYVKSGNSKPFNAWLKGYFEEYQFNLHNTI